MVFGKKNLITIAASAQTTKIATARGFSGNFMAGNEQDGTAQSVFLSENPTAPPSSTTMLRVYVPGP